MSSSAASIHEMAGCGDAKGLAALLSSGASIESLDDEGNTPLMAAVSTGQTTCVELLLSKGANVNAANRSLGSLTPLHIAAHAGDKAIVTLLIAGGADPEAMTTNALTPFDAADQMGHADVATLIVAAQLDAGARASRQPPTIPKRPWWKLW